MSGMKKLNHHFLIAMPSMGDPNFAGSVTLMCRHNDEGAMGITVNRASQISLGDLLEQMDIETDNPNVRDLRVLSGGPVKPELGFVLHDGIHDRWDSTLQVADGICLTTSRDILEAIAAGHGPEHVAVALGFAGWEAGQLEDEMMDETWLTVEANASIVFQTDLDQRWHAATNLIGFDSRQLSSYSGHA